MEEEGGGGGGGDTLPTIPMPRLHLLLLSLNPLSFLSLLLVISLMAPYIVRLGFCIKALKMVKRGHTKMINEDDQRKRKRPSGQANASKSWEQSDDIFYFDTTGLIGNDGCVPTEDWICPECKKAEIPSKPEANPPADEARSTHSLSSLYALAEAGDQIEKEVSSNNNSLTEVKQLTNALKDNEKATEDQQDGVGELPILVVGDAVLLVREHEEKKQGLGRGMKYTTAGKARKEKFANARQRQKRKIANRKAIDLNKEKSLACNFQSQKLEDPVSISNRWSDKKMRRGSSSNSGHNSKSNQAISIRPLNLIPHYLATDVSMKSKQRFSTVRRETNTSSLKNSGLDFPPRSMLSVNVNNNMISSWSGLNSSREELWFEEELDSLWVGVRRHGQGYWETILGDSTLKFSRSKTSLDLSKRWQKEMLIILTSDYVPGKESKDLHDHSTSQRLPQINWSQLTVPSTGDAIDRSLASRYPAPTLKACHARFQEHCTVPERRSKDSSTLIIPGGAHHRSTSLMDQGKMPEIPLPQSPATRESSRGFHLGSPSFKNQLHLGGQEKGKSKLLVGDSSQLNDIEVERKESSDSSDTDSDLFMMVRHQPMDISSDETMSD